jgi:glycosyltransferase involved in cell wall biosynthesis
MTAGAAVVASSHLRDNNAIADQTLDKLCDKFDFKFALVNSIESRIVLPTLSKHFIPTVSLIHEFAAYTRPRRTFTDAIFWSTRIVFSTQLTRENAFTEYSHLGDWAADAIPQGRCLAPPDDLSDTQIKAERERVRRALRPDHDSADSVIVLGVGFVQFRKGVDLFIDCAARVFQHPEGHRFRFIWIGGGFDPERDARYSVYLEDQVSRADLKNRVFFLDETSAIDTAYEAADILLLSSRLDPLPNVAIDAMASGLPVLCFDKTTGIADILTDNGLKSHCVAGYLDTFDMAQKLLALASSLPLRTRVGQRCQDISKIYFDMKNYAAQLVSLATDSGERSRLERADVQTIVDSDLFRSDFSCPFQVQGQTVEDKVRFYVRGWASGVCRRKPMPGFHPGIYLEQHGVSRSGTDPFADWLRAGRPGGPWSYPVIVPGDTDENVPPERRRVALHIHAYWPELLPEIMSRLSRNRVRPDLFISVSDDAARALVTDSLENYAGDIAAVSVVPNRGRDIGPFLTEFGRAMMVRYDFVGHVHTKKSTDIADASMGSTWFRFMLENLVGGQSGAAADSILSHMSRDSSLGMVFPDDPHIVQWGENRALAEGLAQRMRLGRLPEHFIFPVGTMFWARSSALERLMDLGLGWTDYPAEPLPYDGTLLHAIERLFSLVVYAAGFRCAATNVRGLTR